LIESAVGTDGYADTLTGDAGANRLEGWAGDDTLTGDAGDDALDGGAGLDTASYIGAPAGVTVDLAAGTAAGGGGSDALVGIERVLGTIYADSLTGGGAAETLNGRTGNDNISGGGGDDTLVGGFGIDWARYSFAPGPVSVDLAAGIATGAAGQDTLSEFENVIGSLTYGDTLSGDGLANVLQGWAGDDVLRGRGGDDTLDGGAGLDRATYDDAAGAVNVYLYLGTASGAAGSDDLVGIEDVTGGAFGDTLVGDAAANRIEGGDGDDDIHGREGDDVLGGGAGLDTANYWDAPAFVYADLGGGASEFGGGHDTLTGFENLAGSSFGD
jgi:Ca2+-binding RTX toxin-like protein